MYILLVLTPIRDTYHTYTSPILDSMEAVRELSKQFPRSLLFTLCLNKRALTESLELKGIVPPVEGGCLITLAPGG